MQSLAYLLTLVRPLMLREREEARRILETPLANELDMKIELLTASTIYDAVPLLLLTPGHAF